jgi:Family of unknown function (DUF5996)
MYTHGAAPDVWPALPLDAWRDTYATLLTFLQSTYEAAADLAGWDRSALER